MGSNTKITLKVNGQDHQLAIEPRVTLLDALREHLHLTGPSSDVITDSAVPGFIGILTRQCVALAIANAVYHATGGRVRDLPITFEKLIG
jgi:aerobic-type carbon monoxide dehydrogenase small subunit (CoxS/CutS family)